MQYLILDWIPYRREKNAIQDITELLTKLEYEWQIK